MWNRLRQLGLAILPGVPRSIRNPAGAQDTSVSFLNNFTSQQRGLSCLVTNGGIRSQLLLQPWKSTLSSVGLIVPGDQSSTSSTSITYSGSLPAVVGGGYFIQSRGMKIKGRIKRRCKDCYLIWENGVIHNRCKTHPRHTQKQKEKYFVNQRILTHASSSPQRPW